MAKISMGTPFPGVPTGNEHCCYATLTESVSDTHTNSPQHSNLHRNLWGKVSNCISFKIIFTHTDCEKLAI